MLKFRRADFLHSQPACMQAKISTFNSATPFLIQSETHDPLMAGSACNWDAATLCAVQQLQLQQCYWCEYNIRANRETSFC
jgi:hypothetical protein